MDSAWLISSRILYGWPNYLQNETAYVPFPSWYYIRPDIKILGYRSIDSCVKIWEFSFRAWTNKDWFVTWVTIAELSWLVEKKDVNILISWEKRCKYGGHFANMLKNEWNQYMFLGYNYMLIKEVRDKNNYTDF